MRYILAFILCLQSFCLSAHEYESEIRVVTPDNAEKFGINVYYGGANYWKTIKVKAAIKHKDMIFKGFNLAFGNKWDDPFEFLASTDVNGCKTESDVELAHFHFNPERISKVQIQLFYLHRKKDSEWEVLQLDLESFILKYNLLKPKEQKQSWWSGLVSYEDKTTYKMFDRSFDCQ